MELGPAGRPRIFLSTLRPSASDRRQASASIAVALLIFAFLAPLARVPLAPVCWCGRAPAASGVPE